MELLRKSCGWYNFFYFVSDGITYLTLKIYETEKIYKLCKKQGFYIRITKRLCVKYKLNKFQQLIFILTFCNSYLL